MGEYFCEVCKFYDDETPKGQFRCDDCGICRLDLVIQSCCVTTTRVENSIRHHCPVCCEYLFDSILDITVLKCGHTMHRNCLNKMKKHEQHAFRNFLSWSFTINSCPICFKSIFDMSTVWRMIDDELGVDVATVGHTICG
ncbi:E3 ubiquitin-protein ligase [Nymphaea thermarum]|nr:E3 ubiquitin-protein ligase [Nymphaea thermarum]